MEELKLEYPVDDEYGRFCANDSVLRHFSIKRAVDTDNSIDSIVDCVDNKVTTEIDIKAQETAEVSSSQSDPTESPCYQHELRHIWPKKHLKLAKPLESATLLQKNSIFKSIIRSCLLINPLNTLSLPILFELIKKCQFTCEYMNSFRYLGMIYDSSNILT